MDWPESTESVLLDVLRDKSATESDLLVAAELAGDFAVINDELNATLIVLMENGEQSEEIRAQAAISLGPVLEQSDTDGFEDTADLPSEDEAGGSSPSSACTSFAASMHRSSRSWMTRTRERQTSPSFLPRLRRSPASGHTKQERFWPTWLIPTTKTSASRSTRGLAA